MFNKNTDFSYDVDPEFDFTIDEKANKFMALRKIRWGSSEEYKLDLRNYVSTEEGERMLKGCTFISDEGAHELTRVLLNQGYGHADELATEIVDREDLCGAVASELLRHGPKWIEEQADKYDSLKKDEFYALENDLDDEGVA